MRNDEMTNCPQCENHCPADDLRCGRGRRYFEEDGMEGPDEMRHECHRHHGPHDRFHEPDEERHHGRGCRRHRDEDCRHERRPHPPLDPDTLEGAFRMCARAMRHERHQRFGSTQDDIIRILNENGGTMGQKALQELLHVRPGSISEILSKMEEKGLIERNRSEDDRRASLIALKTEALPAKDDNDFFSVLSEEEKEQLKALLKKVLADKVREEPEED